LARVIIGPSSETLHINRRTHNEHISSTSWPKADIRIQRSDRGTVIGKRAARRNAPRPKPRDALRALLDQGDVAVIRVGLDKYGGRVLADATTRGTPDVSNALLMKGLARPYSGGHRESWCCGL